MYLEDEFSKRERVTEDLHRIFDRFEMSPDIGMCVRDILGSGIPPKDALNPKAIEKRKWIVSTQGKKKKSKQYMFGENSAS